MASQRSSRGSMQQGQVELSRRLSSRRSHRSERTQRNSPGQTSQGRRTRRAPSRSESGSSHHSGGQGDSLGTPLTQRTWEGREDRSGRGGDEQVTMTSTPGFSDPQQVCTVNNRRKLCHVWKSVAEGIRQKGCMQVADSEREDPAGDVETVGLGHTEELHGGGSHQHRSLEDALSSIPEDLRRSVHS